MVIIDTMYGIDNLWSNKIGLFTLDIYIHHRKYGDSRAYLKQ